MTDDDQAGAEQDRELRELKALDDAVSLAYERYLIALLARDERVTVLYSERGYGAAVLAHALDVNRSWPKRIAESFPGRLARFRERRAHA